MFFILAALYITGCFAREKPPNFIIMLADDLGYGDIGCFGNNTINTPNIDRLAVEGTMLTQALTAEAICTPSRAAFLTGRYPKRTGLASEGLVGVIASLGQGTGLPQSEVTFAKILQKRGYSTSLIGKWHLGLNCDRWGDFCHHPNRHGFDYYYGIPLTNMRDFGDKLYDGSVITAEAPNIMRILYSCVAVSLISAVFLRRHGFTWSFRLMIFLTFLFLLGILICNSFKFLSSVLMRNGEVVEQPIRLETLTKRFVSESVEFIEEQAKKDKPFLLFLSFNHVHTALATAPEFTGVSQHGRYGDNVEEMDWAVGEVMKSLLNLGLVEDTFILFTSDNGGHLEEYGDDGVRQGGHNGILKGGKLMGGMEGGIRVPTIIRYPSRIPAEREVDVPVSLMDIFPTIVKLAGESLPSDREIDGKDIFDLLQGHVTKSPHRFLFHYCGKYIHSVRYIESESVVWKLHFAHTRWLPGKMRCHYTCKCADTIFYTEPKLYNIQEDPSEEHPIQPHSDKYKEIFATVTEAVEEHKQTLRVKKDEFTLSKIMWKPWLQPCCNFPFCQCTDPKH